MVFLHAFSMEMDMVVPACARAELALNCNRFQLPMQQAAASGRMIARSLEHATMATVHRESWHASFWGGGQAEGLRPGIAFHIMSTSNSEFTNFDFNSPSLHVFSDYHCKVILHFLKGLRNVDTVSSQLRRKMANVADKNEFAEFCVGS